MSSSFWSASSSRFLRRSSSPSRLDFSRLRLRLRRCFFFSFFSSFLLLEEEGFITGETLLEVDLEEGFLGSNDDSFFFSLTGGGRGLLDKLRLLLLLRREDEDSFFPSFLLGGLRDFFLDRLGEGEDFSTFATGEILRGLFGSSFFLLRSCRSRSERIRSERSRLSDCLCFEEELLGIMTGGEGGAAAGTSGTFLPPGDLLRLFLSLSFLRLLLRSPPPAGEGERLLLLLFVLRRSAGEGLDRLLVLELLEGGDLLSPLRLPLVLLSFDLDLDLEERFFLDLSLESLLLLLFPPAGGGGDFLLELLELLWWCGLRLLELLLLDRRPLNCLLEEDDEDSGGFICVSNKESSFFAAIGIGVSTRLPSGAERTFPIICFVIGWTLATVGLTTAVTGGIVEAPLPLPPLLVTLLVMACTLSKFSLNILCSAAILCSCCISFSRISSSFNFSISNRSVCFFSLCEGLKTVTPFRPEEEEEPFFPPPGLPPAAALELTPPAACNFC
jgi:hypothetical protein